MDARGGRGGVALIPDRGGPTAARPHILGTEDKDHEDHPGPAAPTSPDAGDRRHRSRAVGRHRHHRCSARAVREIEDRRAEDRLDRGRTAGQADFRQEWRSTVRPPAATSRRMPAAAGAARHRPPEGRRGVPGPAGHALPVARQGRPAEDHPAADRHAPVPCPA